ncbi:hypothetical protein [Piscinibacter sp.]|uniref:hypothetical protein n=1 Tax=Piscinibacter sp. TaxID=1903157 RepID=UPI002BB2B119|nr:hypothetical protein [Albitalea sp.]HUG23639.1 hypothetical protein [Albitalea sp.]
MPPRPMAQTALFEDAESPPVPRLPQDVQIQLLRQVVQWMQTVALAINREVRDEQDYR